MRVDKAAGELVITDDRQRYEALKREAYNRHQVTTESLIVKVCALLGCFERPSWVAAEFDAPIPHNAPSWLVTRAESDASETMRLSESSNGTDTKVGLEMSEAVQRSLFDLSRFVGQQFATLEDVKQWCKAGGKEYRPCH